MAEFFSAIGNAIMDNLMVPVIVIIAGALIAIFQPKINKLVSKHLAKEDLKELNEENTLRKNLIELIDKQVGDAVASNMSLANVIREQHNGTIPEEEGIKLANNAKQLVMNALPLSLTQDDGNLSKIIGGKNRLEAIIQASLEKSVYELKYREKQLKQQSASATPPKTSQPDLLSLMKNRAGD